MENLLKTMKNSKMKIILNHRLFGNQKFIVDAFSPILDEHRIGVCIKGENIFIYKKDIIKEDYNSVSDGNLTIRIEKV